MNAALLLLRIVTGLLLAGHGVQKVSHRLGGDGLAGGIEEFRADGFRGGVLTALAAGDGQILGGLLLVAGALTPLAAATGIGVMTVAVTVKWRHGLWAQHDGYEFPGFLVVVSAALALSGPGAWSVDRLLGRQTWPLWAAVSAVGAGVASGLATRAVLGGHRPAETAAASGGSTD